MDQALAFENEVSRFEFAVFLDCSEEELTRRLLERGKTSGRSDDNEEAIRKRFATFRETCKPVIDMYLDQGRAHRVDASRSEEEIFDELKDLFENCLQKGSTP